MLRASLGRAVRIPTVSELYQGSISTDTIVNNDPNLKPEKSWTSELTAERDLGGGNARATFFFEDTKDALYSQTNVAGCRHVTSIQNVDHIRTNGVEARLRARAMCSCRGLDLAAASPSPTRRSSRTRSFRRASASGSRACRAGARTCSRAIDVDERWSGTLGMRYSGPAVQPLDNSDPNGYAYTGISKFFVVDARAYRISTGSGAASAGIDNLNNYEYWNFHPYPQRTFHAELRFDL